MFSADDPDISIPLNFPDSPEALVLMLVILAVIINGIGAALNSMGTRWHGFWQYFLPGTVILAVLLAWARIRG